MSTQLKALKKERNRAALEWGRTFQRAWDGDGKPTKADEARKDALEAKIDHLDGLIDSRQGYTKRGAVRVTKEPRTYEYGSRYSYYADIAIRSAGPAWSGITRGGYDIRGAEERLARHSYENAREVAYGTRDGRRIEASLREWSRPMQAHETNDTVKNFREFGRSAMPTEFRTPMSTSAGAGGELVTPDYLESDYVPYRLAGRAFADAVAHRPLPSYGVTVYIPAFTGPAGIAVQNTQNSGIQETDPTTEYLSFDLTTQAGQVTVSQQLLDRSGPNFDFDLAVQDQLLRQYNPTLDALVLTTALANANTVTYTAGSFALYDAGDGPSSAAFLSGVVAQSKVNIRTTAGTFLNPNALFITPGRAEYMTSFTDTTGRPLLVPSSAGPYNAAANTGDGDYNVEGPAGFKFNGLPVYTDSNIPTTNSGEYEQAIVLDTQQTVLYEGAPVIRSLNQTLGNDLSVLIQRYQYVGSYQRYNDAVQKINGSGLTVPSWT